MGFIIRDNTILEKYQDDGLTEIVIPEKITKIGQKAFQECQNIRFVQIPETVTFIGESAFADCHNLKKVIMPTGTVLMGKNCFFGCYQLEEINFPEKMYTTERATAQGEKIGIPSGTFEYCSLLKDIVIPEGYEYISGFYFSGLNQYFHLPDSTKIISHSTFVETEVEEFSIPATVQTIMDNAFPYLTKIIYFRTATKTLNLYHPPNWKKDNHFCKIANIIFGLSKQFKETGNFDSSALQECEQIFPNVMDEGKNAVAVWMLEHGQKGIYREWILKNFDNCVARLLFFNDADAFQALLANGTFPTEKIEKFLEMAILNKKYEIQVMLTHAKHQLDAYEPIDKRFKL